MFPSNFLTNPPYHSLSDLVKALTSTLRIIVSLSPRCQHTYHGLTNAVKIELLNATVKLAIAHKQLKS